MIQRFTNKLDELRNNAHSLQDIRHTALAFSIQSAGTVTSFIFNALIARMLGADGAGLFFEALSVTVIATVIGRMGLDGALLRFVASRYTHKDWAGVKGVYGLSMRMVVVTGGVISAALFAVAPIIASHLFNKPDLAEPLRWMSLSILPFALLNLQAESFKGISRVSVAMLLQSVGVPCVALLLLYPLVIWGGLVGAVYAYVLATIMVGMLSAWVWFVALRGYQHIQPDFPLKDVLVSCRSLFVVSVINGAILPWAPLLLLGIWASNAEVGVFAIATRMSMLVSFMLTAIVSVVAPKFASLYTQGNLIELGRAARRAVLLTIAFATPIVLLFIFCGHWVMSAFGESFSEGAQILMVLGIAQFINAACGPVGNLLTMTGNEKWLRISTMRSSAIQFVVALILIPKWGAMGAAIALALSVVANNLWAIFYIRKHLAIDYPYQLIGKA